MTRQDAFLSAFFALPLGTFIGHVKGRQYAVSRSELVGGKSHKLVAHELGGTDYISLNLYLTQSSGALLRPCEMSPDKVISFVLSLRPNVRK
ncbi:MULTISPECIES: hypothetical protein [unclassified Ruegeria]|uniref:hypothetical protein n=1 Tax=unclassified Ruegeria TaxID=2625375 RepID=UPI001487E2C7|nr:MULTISPECIES: hypothetical protein [unclassified Ruegeria]